jgi:hypothetical protein
MTTDSPASHTAAPHGLVRGALALELAPGTAPARAVLGQEDAGRLAGLIGHDLALLAPEAAAPALTALDLVVAGAHFDPAELLRPGWPLHRRLQELHARAPRAFEPPGFESRVIAFGADARGEVPPPLRAEPELLGGPMRVVPFLLVGDPDAVQAVGTTLERELLDRGMARAETALHAQEGFAARIEHARYLTAWDLAALTAMQYRHAGLDALWALLETALLAPAQEAWLDAPPEPLLRYADGEVRMLVFDRDDWRARYAADETDPARLDRGFAHFRARQRQFGAILGAHGIEVFAVEAPGAEDPRAALA